MLTASVATRALKGPQDDAHFCQHGCGELGESHEFALDLPEIVEIELHILDWDVFNPLLRLTKHGNLVVLGCVIQRRFRLTPGH